MTAMCDCCCCSRALAEMVLVAERVETLSTLPDDRKSSKKEAGAIESESFKTIGVLKLKGDKVNAWRSSLLMSSSLCPGEKRPEIMCLPYGTAM